MDSLTQIALGSAIGVATMGRRTPVWKAALWGAVCGTLPDLDVLIDHGDPIRDMTLHRTESHALFYLTLLSAPMAALITTVHRDRQFRRWWLAAWLALITHPLLDVMTVYGTQLGLPFTDFPYYVGSVFVIDPLYTIPLLIGVGLSLRSGAPGLKWNRWGLIASTLYLVWGVAAQAHVRDLAAAALVRTGIAHERMLVTPAPFNSVLWRIVAMTPDGYVEGFHSLLDRDDDIAFNRHVNDRSVITRHSADWHVARIAWFSHGFFRADPSADGLVMRDLRMGLEPDYTFGFVLPWLNAARDQPAPAGSATAAAHARSASVRQLPVSIDLGTALPWLWRRMLGDRGPCRAPVLSAGTPPAC